MKILTTLKAIIKIPKCKAIVLLTIILTLIVQSQVCLATGNSNSGGANVCQIKGRKTLTLLDLAKADIITKNKIFDEVGIQFKTSQTAEILGVDKFREYEKLKARVQSRLDSWRKKSPGAISLIEVGLNSSKMYVTPFKQPSSFNDYSDANYICEDNSTIAASVFFQHKFDNGQDKIDIRGMLINLSHLNALDGISQVYLIIHEAGRAIKVLAKTDDSKLQDLVSVLFSENPETYDLELHPFFGSIFDTYKNLKNFCSSIYMDNVSDKLKQACDLDQIKKSLFSKKQNAYVEYFDLLVGITQTGENLNIKQLDRLTSITASLAINSYGFMISTLERDSALYEQSVAFKGDMLDKIQNFLSDGEKKGLAPNMNELIESFRSTLQDEINSGRFVHQLK